MFVVRRCFRFCARLCVMFLACLCLTFGLVFACVRASVYLSSLCVDVCHSAFVFVYVHGLVGFSNSAVVCCACVCVITCVLSFRVCCHFDVDFVSCRVCCVWLCFCIVVLSCVLCPLVVVALSLPTSCYCDIVGC